MKRPHRIDRLPEQYFMRLLARVQAAAAAGGEPLVDLAERMIEEARRQTSSDRITYRQADAQKLPFETGAFDLVLLSNMIPFFDELARIVESQGHVVLAFSGGSGTPIYVPSDRLRDELGRRGFAEFAEVSAGRGTAFLARKS